jgi:hypothetical protein
MPKYKVTWVREERMYQDFYVEADSQEDAYEKSKDLCDNHDWTDNGIDGGSEEAINCEEVE